MRRLAGEVGEVSEFTSSGSGDELSRSLALEGLLVRRGNAGISTVTCTFFGDLRLLGDSLEGSFEVDAFGAGSSTSIASLSLSALSAGVWLVDFVESGVDCLVEAVLRAAIRCAFFPY